MGRRTLTSRLTSSLISGLATGLAWTPTVAGAGALSAVLAVSVACTARKVPPPPDAGTFGRPASSSRPDEEPLDRPLVPCPVADADDLDRVLDAAADRYDAADYPTSLACADQAARLAPRSVEAHHDRAAALAALERWADAQQAFTMALAIDPDDPETLAGAADLYVNRLPQGRELTEIGLEYARRGAERSGGRRADRGLTARLAVLEAQALDDLGRPDEALTAAETALRHDPASAEAGYERAVSLFQLGRLPAARDALGTFLEAHPDDAYARHHLGLVLERLGDKTQAQLHLARATALDPVKFPPPVLLEPAAFQKLVEGELAVLEPELRALLPHVLVQVEDLPTEADLRSVEPPFSPTILGLYKGAPLELHAGATGRAPTVPDSLRAPGGSAGAGGAGGAGPTPGLPLSPADEPRTIVLYRMNLARAVASPAELERQVRITLRHELGHLIGQDEDELRARGLE